MALHCASKSVDLFRVQSNFVAKSLDQGRLTDPEKLLQVVQEMKPPTTIKDAANVAKPLTDFWTISTKKDEKYAAKFHYIKKKLSAVMLQHSQLPFERYQYIARGTSIAFEILAETDPPPPEGSVKDRKQEVQSHLVRTRHGLSNELSAKVLRCP